MTTYGVTWLLLGLTVSCSALRLSVTTTSVQASGSQSVMDISTTRIHSGISSGAEIVRAPTQQPTVLVEYDDADQQAADQAISELLRRQARDDVALLAAAPVRVKANSSHPRDTRRTQGSNLDEMNREESVEMGIDEVEMATDNNEILSDKAEVTADAAEIRTDEAEVTADAAENYTGKAEIEADHKEIEADHKEIEADHKEIEADKAELLRDAREIASDQETPVAKQTTAISRQLQPVLAGRVARDIVAAMLCLAFACCVGCCCRQQLKVQDLKGKYTTLLETPLHYEFDSPMRQY